MDKPFHITMLHSEMNSRKEANPRYSLRAFAKFLGLGPSTLSRILANRQELSLTACKNIIKKIKFNHDDCMLFIASIAEEKKRRAYKLLYNIIEDATDHEESLNSHEWMIANTPDLMFVFDRRGRCIQANDPVSQFFGIKPELVIGKTLEELGVHAEILRKIESCLTRVFSDPHTIKVEECYEMDGDSRCFEITLVPIGHHKEVKAVACHWRDITEKNHIEKLWQTSRQIGEILAASPDLIKNFNQIASHLTEKYCDACVIDFPNSKKCIQKGSKELLKDFFEVFIMDPEKNVTYKEVIELDQIRQMCHLDEASLIIFHNKKSDVGCITTIPLTYNNKTIGTLSLIRSSERKSFSSNDSDLARDIKMRIERSMVSDMSHLEATL